MSSDVPTTWSSSTASTSRPAPSSACWATCPTSCRRRSSPSPADPASRRCARSSRCATRLRASRTSGRQRSSSAWDRQPGHAWSGGSRGSPTCRMARLTGACWAVGVGRAWRERGSGALGVATAGQWIEGARPRLPCRARGRGRRDSPRTSTLMPARCCSPRRRGRPAGRRQLRERLQRRDQGHRCRPRGSCSWSANSSPRPQRQGGRLGSFAVAAVGGLVSSASPRSGGCCSSGRIDRRGGSTRRAEAYLREARRVFVFVFFGVSRSWERRTCRPWSSRRWTSSPPSASGCSPARSS